MDARLEHLRGVYPIWLDVVTAAALLAISLVDIWGRRPGDGPVTTTAVTVAIAVAVAVRRRWLVAAMAGVVVCELLRLTLAGWHYGDGPSGLEGSLMGLLVFYGAGAYLDGARALVALALGLVIVSLSAFASSGPVVANLVWDDITITALPWFVGSLVRERSVSAQAARERAERLDAEHEMHMRVAALAERARLAREIHDVVAHSVSVMVIQAGGARTVMDADPGRAEQALLSVERAGREALAEMRRLLGVLADGEALRELAPQPGIDDIQELVERSRSAGVVTSITVSGEPVAVPPGLSLCAYRVVQEALTNTLKHAGAVRAEVSVRWLADALELEVADDGLGPGATAALGSSGHGLIGMRERAALHGGQVMSGPLAGGGFAVRARIPLEGLVAA